jgi:glycosyltransferase involved in cell wall biosynthesis
MKISVVMPVYNEINTLEEIIRRVKAIDVVNEIVIVDDGSSDGGREYLQRLENEKLRDSINKKIKIIFHEKNQGKGAALRTGFKFISGEAVIIQDADLEYHPQEYHKVLEPILDGMADVVYGSRFLGGPHRVLFFWHYIGNRFLTLFSNMLNNLNLTDMETGCKVFRWDIIKDIKIKSNRFGFEPEITAKLARKKCRIYEVPISYSGRDYSEGKKITWKDGVAAIFCVIRFWLKD